MIPLKDENPTLITPWLTYAFIAANVLVYFLLQTGGGELAEAKRNFRYAAIPYNVTHGSDEGVAALATYEPSPRQLRIGEIQVQFLPVKDQAQAQADLGATDLVVQPIPWWLTLFTSMFMHGSIMHLLGNMLFLYVFANNIEDATGPLRFVVFYLGTGLVASLVHIFSDTTSLIPTLGASGAVSGVLGGYLLLYPRARVLTFIPLPIFWTTAYLPARIFLIVWLVMQLSGVFQAGGGVAWWAHIGGFAAGVAVIKFFESSEHRDRRERLNVMRHSAVWRQM